MADNGKGPKHGEEPEDQNLHQFLAGPGRNTLPQAFGVKTKANLAPQTGRTLAPPGLAGTNLENAVQAFMNPSEEAPMQVDLVPPPQAPAPAKAPAPKNPASMEAGFADSLDDMQTEVKGKTAEDEFSVGDLKEKPPLPKIITDPLFIPPESPLEAKLAEAIDYKDDAPTRVGPAPKDPRPSYSEIPDASKSVLATLKSLDPTPPPVPQVEIPPTVTASSSPAPAPLPASDPDEQPTKVAKIPKEKPVTSALSSLPPAQKAWFKSALPNDPTGFSSLQRAYLRAFIKANDSTADSKEKTVLESICLEVEQAQDQESLTKALEKLNAWEFSEAVRNIFSRTEETFFEQANIEADRRATQRLREILPASITILEGFRRLGPKLLSTQLSIGKNKFDFSFDPDSFDIIEIKFLNNDLHTEILRGFGGRSLTNNTVVQALNKTLEAIAKNPNKAVATKGRSKVAVALAAAGIVTVTAGGAFYSRFVGGQNVTSHASASTAIPPPSAPPPVSHPTPLPEPSPLVESPTPVAALPVSPTVDPIVSTLDPASIVSTLPDPTAVHSHSITRHNPTPTAVSTTRVAPSTIVSVGESTVGNDPNANTGRALIEIFIHYSSREAGLYVDVAQTAHALNLHVLNARLDHALRDLPQEAKDAIAREFVDLNHDTTALVNHLRERGDGNSAGKIIRLRTHPSHDIVRLERREVRGRGQLRVVVLRDGHELYHTEWLREQRVLRSRYSR